MKIKTIVVTTIACLFLLSAPALAQSPRSKVQKAVDGICKATNRPVNVDSDTAYASGTPPQKVAYKSKLKARNVKKAKARRQ